MSKNSKRYRLCLQCIQETELGEVGNTVVKEVRDRMKKKSKWQNPMFRWFRGNGNFISVLEEVCPNCPYVLEHTVLAKKEVHEQKR